MVYILAEIVTKLILLLKYQLFSRRIAPPLVKKTGLRWLTLTTKAVLAVYLSDNHKKRTR